ncbi:MAG: hypothetical protein IJ860_10055 [Eubacterium sp.]|nr:hypothetical protein [Eubacterium sp.]
MLDRNWEQLYYRETDRAKRKLLLDQAISEEGMTPENELRLHLYNSRYGDSEAAGREVDIFIRGFMTLEYLKSGSKFFMSKRKVNKEMASVRSDWQFDKAAEYGAAGQDILYKELCNLVLLYIQICRRDKAYGSILFGLGQVKEGTLTRRVSDDIFRIACELPRLMDRQDELDIFTRAATRTFCEQFPEESDSFYRRMRELDESRN